MNKDFEEIFELYKSSTSDLQGDVGEVITASRLRNESDLRIIRNVYFPIKDRFCEIDIVGISKSGVYIIENKNYSGKVIGKNSSYYWLVEYPSFKKERLYNPIKQNIRHKEITMRYLNLNGFDSIQIFSPVIFNDGVDLRVVGCSKSVFTLSDFICKYNDFKKEFLSESQISDLYNFFKVYSNVSTEMKDLHKSLLSTKD